MKLAGSAGIMDCSLNDPDRKWQNQLDLLTSVIDKYTYINNRLGKRKSSWITSDETQKMGLRDNLREQFDLTRDVWQQQYRKARNECDNLITRAKPHYFTSSIQEEKTRAVKKGYMQFMHKIA